MTRHIVWPMTNFFLLPFLTWQIVHSFGAMLSPVKQFCMVQVLQGRGHIFWSRVKLEILAISFWWSQLYGQICLKFLNSVNDINSYHLLTLSCQIIAISCQILAISCQILAKFLSNTYKMLAKYLPKYLPNNGYLSSWLALAHSHPILAKINA